MNETIFLPWYNAFPGVVPLRSNENFLFNQESMDAFSDKYFKNSEMHFEFSIIVKDTRTDKIYNTSIHRLIKDVLRFQLSSIGLTMVLTGNDTELSYLINRGIIASIDDDSSHVLELLTARNYDCAVTFANFSEVESGIIMPHGLCIVPEDLQTLPEHILFCSPRGHI